MIAATYREPMIRRAAAVAALGLALGGMLAAGSCEPETAKDTSPGALDVKLIVLDLEAQPSDGKVIVGIQFLSGGSVVDVGSGDIALCDGVTLTRNALLGQAYAGRVPLRPAGQSYRFEYKRGSTTTTVDLPAPARPTLTSPAPGSTLARTMPLQVTYPAGGGAAVIVSTSSPAGSNDHGERPDNGSYGPVDVSAFQAGTGHVALKRVFRPQLSGTTFRSAVGDLTTMSARAPVTWT